MSMNEPWLEIDVDPFFLHRVKRVWKKIATPDVMISVSMRGLPLKMRFRAEGYKEGRKFISEQEFDKNLVDSDNSRRDILRSILLGIWDRYVR